MKKFMTVLLVIAVMFTFSFSTAFAGAAEQEAFADTYSATIGDAYFESLWKAFTEDTTMMYTGGDGWTIDAAVKATVKDQAKAIYDNYMTKVAEAYVTDAAVFRNTVLNWNGSVGTPTAAQNAFRLSVAAAQFAADKAEVLAILATIPTYNYSTEEISTEVEEYVEVVTSKVADDKTYQEAATMLVDFYVAAIEDIDDFNADVNAAIYKDAADAVNAYAGSTYVLPMAYATYDELGAVTAAALTGAYDLVAAYDSISIKAGAGMPEGVTAFIDVNKDTNTWGTASVAADKQTEAAQIAAVKAELAAQYARYIALNTSSAAKTYADKWLKVANILAEEGKTALEIADPDGTAYLTHANYIAELETYAARYGAELNADGELVRDAVVVQKYLDQYTVQIAISTGTGATACNAGKTAIYNAKSELLAARLQYVKDSVNKAVELDLADLADDYYAAEFAKIEAAAAKCTAAVEAATTESKATEAYTTFTSTVSGITDADTLDNLAATWTGAKATLLEAAEAYVEYYNDHVSTTDATADLDSTTLKARIAEMIGESGYRTQAEMKTLKDQAVAVAQGLPTEAEVTAAAKAIKTAVAALPAKATIADLAAVQAVADAIEAYEELSEDAHGVALTKYTNAITAITTAYNTQFAKAYATVDKKDEAAVKALIAEIDAAADAIEDLEGTTTYLRDLEELLEGALTTIKTNEKNAAQKLVNALPLNITEADKAAVEAARAAYDAYVAKYTDITTYADGNLEAGYVVNDINIADLVAAETVLGLNDKSEEIAKMEAIAAIEGLKIKANSSAKKGSITVKWTVSEEVEGVKYQVYKSTKAQKGYKKSITTSKTTFKNTKNLTKGTRYFYKVRAVGEVDGVKYYSDWSNKANRIAK